MIIVFLFLLFSPASLSFANSIDAIEHMVGYGATNVNGLAGNGRLTAGFSRQGELTVLRWPDPTMNDHLYYVTSTAENARSLPHFGAADNHGSFAGLFYQKKNGDSGLTWFRDPGWEQEQSYLSPDSAILVTRASHSSLKLETEAEAFVTPERDVLVQHFKIKIRSGSPVTGLKFIFFINPAPCLRRIAGAPIADYREDDQNNFALFYSSNLDALVSFLPKIAEPPPDKSDLRSDYFSSALALLAPLGENPEQSAADDFVARLDDVFGVGVYFAIGADQAASEYQSGKMNQAAPPKTDAFQDAGDGSLAGSPFSTGSADGALLFNLPPNSLSTSEITVYLAAGENFFGPKGAGEQLTQARQAGYASLKAETEDWWKAWISRARLPRTDDAGILETSKRALITIRASTAKDSGAIVASISAQPPYHLDWPRDGAFINYALDQAGYLEMVTEHNRFYARVQRRADTYQGSNFIPRGSFEMNYYSDGMTGGVPCPFEIDQAGLAVWSMWNHYRYLSEAEAGGYLSEIYPAIRLAAESVFVNCRDAANGLPCPANEDDNPAFTQGLQGAVTVYLGLESAISAAGKAGEDPVVIARWADRLDELRDAITRNFYDPQTGFAGPRDVRAWLIWPVQFWPADDNRMAALGDQLFNEIEPILKKETAGGSYVAKVTLALAHLWSGDQDKLSRLDWANGVLLNEIPTRMTRHYGESYVTVTGSDGKSYFDNRVSIPHVWEAALAYLSALKLYESYAPPGEGGCSGGIARAPANNFASRWEYLPLVIFACCFFISRFFIGRRRL
jgi:GH15 family glucan-1,4-alpha-glucosidase